MSYNFKNVSQNVFDKEYLLIMLNHSILKKNLEKCMQILKKNHEMLAFS